MDNGTDSQTEPTRTPIMCTLTTKDAAAQALEWVDLQTKATDVALIKGGVRMTLPASLTHGVEDLARREAECCAFLTIETLVADGSLTLEITSENPDALPVIVALAGVGPSSNTGRA